MKKIISLLIIAAMSLSIIASCAAPKKSTKTDSATTAIENSETSNSSATTQSTTTTSTQSTQSTQSTISTASTTSVSSNSSESQAPISEISSELSEEIASNAVIEESATQEQMYGGKYAGNFNYEDYETMTSDYNRNLFFYNELKFEVADPSVIYVSKEQDPVNGGYFYAYGTSDQLMCNGLQAWRSADMTNWEDLGPVYMPNYEDNWCYTNYWAPECIYDPAGMVIDGKTYHYFMFYNAELWSTVPKGENATGTGDFYIGVLYAETAAGPFYAPENYRNANNELLTHSAAPFDFRTKGKVGARTVDCIDASPFIDSNNDKYMYYSGFGAIDGQNGAQCIYGVKMKDWFSPDYSTLKMICEYGKKTPGGASISEGDNVNEGPFMYKNGNTYMLTFSTYGYQNSNYQVRLATSTSPLGTFTKLNPDAGGTVIKTLATFQVKSAGHHVFIKVGDQLYIAYHTFKDRSSIAGGRALAIDEVHVIDYNGQKVFLTNGPTYSYQPLPSALSGYANIANQATFTGDGLTNASALTDKQVKFHTSIGYTVPEAQLSKNGTLTMTFSTYKNVRAVMVYFPLSFWSRFTKAKVEITYKSTSGDKVITIDEWKYDVDHHFLTAGGRVYPGGSAILEFNELPVKSMKFYFTSPSSSKSTMVEIDEIVVLGSTTNTTITAVSDSQLAQPYTYMNALVPVAVAHPQGTTIGSVNVDGTPLYATRGVDVSQDTETSKLVKFGMPRDQMAYFKGVSSKNAYFEAEFNVYATKAYLDDKWPKLGLIVKNAQACTFFYIDAVNQYTNKWVGYTQSKLGGGTWDWSNTEAIVSAGSIRYYKSDGWTKLAILRLGNEFYFYCNDKLVFTSTSLRGLGTSNNAGYGFLCFNTGMQVRNYNIITNVSAIEAKLAELGSSFEEDPTQGDTITTFGSNSAVTSSAAWDLTKDYAQGVAQYNERKVTLSTSDGEDNYLYFKNANVNNFYAEATFKATAVYNSEQWGKYGFAIFSRKSDTKTKTGIFYYVDAANGGGGYIGKAVSYVNVNNDAFSWGVAPTVAGTASSDPITIGIYRQGTIVKMLKNGEVVFTTSADLASAIYPCIFSFNIGLEVTDYSIITSKTDPKMVELYVKETDDDGFTDALFGTLENTVGYTANGWTTNGMGWASNSTAGEARTLVTNLGGTKFFFETNITLNSILNNDGYPKAGIFVKNTVTELFFCIDALPNGKTGAAYFGGNDWVAYGTRSCAGSLGTFTFPEFREAFGMKYTQGNKCAMGIYYDNGTIVLTVNRAPLFVLSGISGLTGDTSVGVMTFNLNADVTNAKFTIDFDALAVVRDSIGLESTDANIVVDGNIADWTGTYATKYSFWDDAGRGFEVMATMGTNGVYVAYHGIVDHWNTSETDWWLNTNVEMVAYPKTTAEKLQVYVSADGQHLRTNVYGYSYKTRTDEKLDVYFELYIPYVDINYSGSEESVVLCFALRPGNYNGVADVSSQGWNWWAGQYGAWDQSNAFTGYVITKNGIVLG